MKKSAKIVLTIIALLILFPILISYINLNPLFLSWVYIWLALWGWVLLGSGSIEQRAVTFLLGSVILGVLGPQLIQDKTVQGFLVNTISQVMLVMGGGIGASIIASHLFENEKK